MQIATWNINGVRARIDTALAWIAEAKPDVLCLQEIKCETEAFPTSAFEDAGYNVAVHGQKGFNGVALLSRSPIQEIKTGLDGDDSDTHSRYIEAVVSAGRSSVVRVAGIYLPNGNPIGSDKFTYKLSWMDRLKHHLQKLLSHEEMLVVAGDWNVIPQAIDAKNPANWVDDALYQPESRAKFREILNLGFTDAVRASTPEAVYTFWDYQAMSWQRNNGIRIDHLLLSPQATDRLAGVRIDKHVRGWDKPSDHVPVIVDLAVA